MMAVGPFRARIGALLAAACLALGPSAAGAAHAEVKAVAPDGFDIHGEALLDCSRSDAWRILIRIGDWWSDAHTYSGAAKNMKLTAKAGGLWREVWAGGDVQHGRVVMLMPGRRLRLDAALGPLQDMGVTGALTFTLDEAPLGQTKVTMDYRVTGASTSHLDGVAGIVDQVLGEQMQRLDALR